MPSLLVRRSDRFLIQGIQYSPPSVFFDIFPVFVIMRRLRTSTDVLPEGNCRGTFGGDNLVKNVWEVFSPE